MNRVGRRPEATSPTRTRCSSRRTSSSAGPGTPGVLVVKARSVKNTVPALPGGGTVAYVDARASHRYVADSGAARRGRHAGDHRIDPRGAGVPAQGRRRRRGDPRAEGGFIQRAIASWRQNPNIHILGNPSAWRLSIVSFIVRHGAALPPSQLRRRAAQRSVRHPGARRLLLRRSVRPPPARHRPRSQRANSSARSMRGCEGIKPGWVRVNFNYFISNAEFQYIVAAVNLVGQYGHVLLPDYQLDLAVGSGATSQDRRTCQCASSISATASGKLEYPVAPRAPARERARRAARRGAGNPRAGAAGARARRPGRPATARGSLRAAALVRDAGGGRARPAQGAIVSPTPSDAADGYGWYAFHAKVTVLDDQPDRLRRRSAAPRRLPRAPRSPAQRGCAAIVVGIGDRVGAAAGVRGGGGTRVAGVQGGTRGGRLAGGAGGPPSWRWWCCTIA